MRWVVMIFLLLYNDLWGVSQDLEIPRICLPMQSLNNEFEQETQETWVRFLGWENPLEEGMATHSSILAGKIAWAEELGGLQSMGSQRVGHD